MTDIVERLRGPAPHMIGPLMDEAADEIERLREKVEMIMSINHQQGDDIERLRKELRNPIMRRMEGDRFGISICWDDHMISGMQKSTDEVFRIVHVVKLLRDEYPDLYAHLAKIADQMLKLIERTQADRRYDAAALEELRRDFPDLFTKAV